MLLLTVKILKALPAIGSTSTERDPIAHVKFFTPDSNWSWFATEYDPLKEFFGLVFGLEREFRYFTLAELMAARGPLGMPIERDRYFVPCPVSKLTRYS